MVMARATADGRPMTVDEGMFYCERFRCTMLAIRSPEHQALAYIVQGLKGDGYGSDNGKHQ